MLNPLSKNPTADTFNNSAGATRDGAYFIDLDNIGNGDAVITCSDNTTFVLRMGSSKSFATGTPLAPMNIDATGTVVQAVYTF